MAIRYDVLTDQYAEVTQADFDAALRVQKAYAMLRTGVQVLLNECVAVIDGGDHTPLFDHIMKEPPQTRAGKRPVKPKPKR